MLSLLKKTILMLLLILVTTAIKAQVKEEIISESFYSNKNNWPESDNEFVTAKINDGGYFLHHKRQTNSWVFSIQAQIYQGENFYIETEFSKMEGDATNGAGIVWGLGRTGYFAFVVNANGSFYIRKFVNGKNGVYLEKYTKSEAIKKGNAVNKLRVQKQDDELVFFINDKYVSRMPFVAFFGPEVGVVLYGYQKILVKNFEVYGSLKKEKTDQSLATLNILRYGVNDDKSKSGAKLGNANSRIEVGETVEIAVMVTNSGVGQISDVYAHVVLQTKNKNAFYPDAKKYYKLGDFKKGDSKLFTFYFVTTSKFAERELNFKVEFLNSDETYYISENIIVPLHIKLPTAQYIENQILEINKHTVVEEKNIDNYIPTTFNNGSDIIMVIMGVENYLNCPVAQYAVNDITMVYKYAVKMLNVKPENILVLKNEQVTKKRLSEIFGQNGWLSSKAIANRSKIIIYYAGHGASDIEANMAHIIPYDAIPNNSNTWYSLQLLFAGLQRINAASVSLLFDANFAGVNRNKQPFISNGGTLWAIPTFPVIVSNNFTALYASIGEQANLVAKVPGHGMFTYYLLKTLQESADKGESLTYRQIFQKISNNMVADALSTGNDIIPKLDGTGGNNYILK